MGTSALLAVALIAASAAGGKKKRRRGAALPGVNNVRTIYSEKQGGTLAQQAIKNGTPFVVVGAIHGDQQSVTNVVHVFARNNPSLIYVIAVGAWAAETLPPEVLALQPFAVAAGFAVSTGELFMGAELSAVTAQELPLVLGQATQFALTAQAEADEVWGIK